MLSKVKAQVLAQRSADPPLGTALADLNYSTDAYGSRNVQLRSFLSRSPYTIQANRQVGPYASAYREGKLDLLVEQLVERLMAFQKRTCRNEPQKKRMKRRLVFGMSEIQRSISLGKVCALIVATNIEPAVVCSAEYKQLIEAARLAGVACVYASTRGKLGGFLGEKISISVVAVVDVQSLEVLWREVVELSQKLTLQWKQDVLKSISGNVNAFSAANESVLFIASYFGHFEVAKAILEEHSSLLSAVEHSNGMLPIHIATIEGHLALVEIFTKANAALLQEKTFSLKDCAYLAVECNQKSILAFIAAQNALSGAVYISGHSLLTLAVEKGFEGCVRILIDNNCTKGVCPFRLVSCASKNKNFRVLQLVLEHFFCEVTFEQVEEHFSLMILEFLDRQNFQGCQMLLSFLGRKRKFSLSSVLSKGITDGNNLIQIATERNLPLFAKEFSKYAAASQPAAEAQADVHSPIVSEDK